MNANPWTDPRTLMEVVLVSAFLCAGSCLAAALPPSTLGAKGHLPSESAGFHPGRILVKPKRSDGGQPRDLAQVHAAGRMRVAATFETLRGWQVVELSDGMDVRGAIQHYLRSGAVEGAEPDYEVSISASPNDPKYLDGSQWGLNNTGQSGGVADADIDAPEAWDIRTSAANVVVAVVDTGIRATHEDLAANLWINPGEIAGNGLDDDGNGYVDDVHGINAIAINGAPVDDHGHGTHVAGIIGAVGNNGRGVAGVAWTVRLMACKFIRASGSGYVSDAIRCINYARAKGARVINASWAGPDYAQALKDAIDATAADGIVFVAAAGNSGVDVDRFFTAYPAGYSCENLVAVAATTRSDTLDYASNWGLGLTDLGAPGRDIPSAWHTADSAYTVLSGTSMAAPHVSGAFALMKAQFPGESHLQLFNRVFAATDRLPALAGKCRTGGRLNLQKALASVSSAPGNDNFTSRLPVGAGSFSISGINMDATAERREPDHAGNAAGKSIWWSWQPSVPGVATLTTSGSSFDTVLAVYTGSEVTRLTLVAGNDNDPAGGTLASRLIFEATPGVDYSVAVDGVNAASGSAVLNLSFLARPPNDLFANRIAITGSLATVTGSNTVATLESSEPLHAGQPGGSSVWWSWTAPASGRVAVSTAGSDFNTVLAVYAGSQLASLSLVAANDDDPAGGTNTSRVTFDAVAGTAYQIAVDGYGGATGSIVLRTPPLNDHFTNRIAIPATTSGVIGYSELAGKEALEPAHAGDAGGKSLWWSWTCPASGMATFSTVGSSFDTLLAVYTGSSLGALTLVAANDNAPYGGVSSLLTFNATAGQTYQIAVDGVGGAGGVVKLVIGTGYVIADLGVMGGGFDNALANGINERNQVAGYCYNYPGFLHQAFLWNDGVLMPLGTLGGTESEAKSVNDLGQVVGWARSATGRPRAFLWHQGVMRDLGSFEPDAYSEAWSINNAGQVVGFSYVAGKARAFLWHNEVLTDITPVGSTRCWAMSINQAGDITGQNSWLPSQYTFPYLWRNGDLTMLPTPPGGIAGEGRGINNLRQIVGDYYTTLDRAFLWDRGEVADLGLLPGGTWAKAIGLNDLGHVVGQADTRAFLWRDGQMTNLNSYLPAQSDWVLYGATAVNNRGQIVGWGTLNGQTRAFLMSPPNQPLPPPYLAAPTNSHTCFAGSDVAVEVLLSRTSAGVDRVELRAGAILLSTLTNTPGPGSLLAFSGRWATPPIGSHAVFAQATCQSGVVTTSKTVTVSILPPPSLSWARLPHDLRLAWPAEPSGLLLEYATDLSPAALWQTVTDPALTLEGTNWLDVSLTNDARFFRLRLAPNP